MNVRVIIKIIEQDGWFMVRSKGSQVQLIEKKGIRNSRAILKSRIYRNTNLTYRKEFILSSSKKSCEEFFNEKN
jgi:hypothetical protein